MGQILCKDLKDKEKQVKRIKIQYDKQSVVDSQLRDCESNLSPQVIREGFQEEPNN